MKFIFPGLSFLFALSLFACGESTESEPANSNRPSSDCPYYNAGSRNAKNENGGDECSSESARCSYRDPNGNGSEYVSCFCNGGYYAEDGWLLQHRSTMTGMQEQVVTEDVGRAIFSHPLLWTRLTWCSRGLPGP